MSVRDGTLSRRGVSIHFYCLCVKNATQLSRWTSLFPIVASANRGISETDIPLHVAFVENLLNYSSDTWLNINMRRVGHVWKLMSFEISNNTPRDLTRRSQTMNNFSGVHRGQFSKTHGSVSMSRWRYIFQNFDFSIRYKGRKHSRHPTSYWYIRRPDILCFLKYEVVP